MTSSGWLASSTSTSPGLPLTITGRTSMSLGSPPQAVSIDSRSRCHAASCQTLRRTGLGARRSAMSPPGGSHAYTGISVASLSAARLLACLSARILLGLPELPAKTRANKDTTTHLLKLTNAAKSRPAGLFQLTSPRLVKRARSPLQVVRAADSILNRSVLCTCQGAVFASTAVGGECYCP